MRRIIGYIAAALVAAMVFAACSANTTVNEQLLPFLTVDDDGGIWVTKGAAIKDLRIPAGTAAGGNGVFMGFRDPDDAGSVASVTIENGVKGIGDKALQGTNITSIVLPPSVTSVGSDAFNGVDTLTSVTIQGDSTALGSDAFAGTAITDLSIPASLTANAGDTFGNKLQNLTVTGSTADSTIAAEAFKDQKDLANVKLEGITEIKENAFSGCSKLDSITFPEGLTTIGNGAFTGAGTDTIEYKLPASVSDADGAFDSEDKVSQKFDIYIGDELAGSFTAKLSPADD